MCLVFVSLNEHGVRSGIPAHASVWRPEVESGIHLVCLVFIGGSGPSDKGGGGGGAVVPGSSTGLSVSHQMHPNRTGLFVVNCGIFSYLCCRSVRMCSFLGLKFNVWALPLIEPRNARRSCSIASDESQPAQVSLSLPNLSNTGAEGSAASRTLVNFFRLLQTWASSARSGELLCWFCYTL